MALFGGLDLGQMTDHAAFVLNSPDCSVWPPIHRIQTIKMWELGTRYEQIEQDLKAMIEGRKLSGLITMGVEINGPGPRVVEAMQTMMPARIEPIFTCGGAGITTGPEGYLHIAKGQILISSVQAALCSDRIKIANTYWREELYRQLEVFGVKISKAGNEQFEAIGEAKDDIVLALSFAIVLAEHYGSMGRDQITLISGEQLPQAKLQKAMGTHISLVKTQQTSQLSRAIFGANGRPSTAGGPVGPRPENRPRGRRW